jgi:hypothetical protein
VGQKPTFFRPLIYIYYFFITINKRKKWESGPKRLKPLQSLGLSWPGFENKSGPKPKKSGPKYQSRPSQPYEKLPCPEKSGPNPF